MSMNRPRRPQEQPGRRPYYRPGPAYPGYQQPSYCPYGGTAYTLQSDTDVTTLASQLGVTVSTLLNYNPSLDISSTVSSGTVICVP